jgi:hypothetical protein
MVRLWSKQRAAAMTDEEHDDWAPLSPAQLAARPGECDAAPLPPPPPPSALHRTPRPPTPLGERAMRELERRCLATPPSDSLVAHAARRERRGERQQQLARSAGAALTATVVDARDDPPAHVVVDHAASDLDPREMQPWFRELPAGEQERLRSAWHDERHRFDHVAVARRRRLARALGFGALCFFLLGVCQSLLMGGLGLVPLLTLAGAVAAFGAECCGGGRFAYSFAGAIAFVVVMGPFVFLQPLGLCSLLFATYGLGLMGMDSEMRRSGGFRDA